MILPERNENPYFFNLHAPATEEGDAFEAEVKREQRQTVFEANPHLQRIFKGDFNLYNEAFENPARFMELMRSLTQEHEDHSRPFLPSHPHRQWEEGEGEGAWENEDIEDFLREVTGQGDEEYQEQEIHDTVFLHAEEWAVSLHRWSHTLYFNRKVKNRDLFRIHENAFAISDLVYESCRIIIDEGSMASLAAIEMSLAPLRVGRIFLGRCIDSLLTLRTAHIGARTTVERHVVASMKLLKMLDNAILEKEEQLAKSGRWEYFNGKII